MLTVGFSVCAAAALALDPGDATAAGFRARQLRVAIEEVAGARLGDTALLQGLADMLRRDLKVVGVVTGAVRLVLPAWGSTDHLVAPLVLLASPDPAAPDRTVYDAVTGRMPAVMPAPASPSATAGLPLPPPASAASTSSPSASSWASRRAPRGPIPVVPGCTPLDGPEPPIQLASPLTLEPGLSPCVTPRACATPPRARGLINVATWNIRGGARPAVREAVDAALLAKDVHVAVLQETRLPRQDFATTNYRWFLEGAPPRGGRGVGLLVRQGLPEVTLRSTALLGPNVILAELLLWGMHFTVLGVHIPGDGQPGQRGALDALNAGLATAQPRHWKLVLGDFNSHISPDELHTHRDVLGPLLHPGQTNVAGAALLGVARLHNLKLFTTLPRARGCTVTWQRGGAHGQLPPVTSQLDHVLGNYHRLARVRADFVDIHRAADHKLVVASLSAPRPEDLPCQANPPPPPPPGEGFAASANPHDVWDMDALARSPALQDRYASTVAAAVSTVGARGGDLSWPQLSAALTTAANAVLRPPASPLTPRRRAAANQYRAALHAAHHAPGDRHAAYRLQAAVRARRAAVRQHKADKLRLRLSTIQGARPVRRMHLLYRFLRRSRRTLLARGAGVTIRAWEAEVQRQAEGEQPQRLPEEDAPVDYAPTAAQLRACAQRLSARTAPGPDGLPGELFKPREVDDFRTLSLCAAVYKIVALHLLDILQTVVPALPYYQAGFQAGRSTYGHIFLVRRLLDAFWQVGTPVHLLALDIKAAFPSVSKASVVQALQEAAVPPSLINRVVALALRDRTYVRWGAAATSIVLRGRGVRQGCGVSPFLFLLVLHMVVRRVVAPLPRFSLDFEAPGMVPILCAYADDVLVLSDRLEDVCEFLAAFRAGLAAVGLELNLRKSEYLVRSPVPDPLPLPRPAWLAGMEVPQVSQLVYLGALITTTLSRQPGVYHRVRRAQRSLAGLLPALRAQALPVAALDELHRTVLRPAIDYELGTASETQRTRASLRRNDGLLLGALRATARPARPGDQPPLRLQSAAASVRAARIRFRGHIARRPPGHPLRRALAFTAPGRLKQGRPCFDFPRSLQESLARLPPPPAGWEALLLDKVALAAYLRDAAPLRESSDEEAPPDAPRHLLYRQGDSGSSSDSD
ncbi:Transposon TX1 uncharacterized 149 kDa protein [Frankliniella fusca]|uniref:Transposon TX1 uncharacterized 149 kDa protein n=1 Tax=Frankliniella fusca TaxID=407009 RepID=A0AAE1HH29_9NEOP|nr:Transposon TX1 uncharacterized 149 kDa protein [Frankliniella fusca]